MKDWKESNINL
jgi:cytoskeleton-associated protein 5